MRALVESEIATSLNQVSTAVAGEAFAVPSPPTRHGGGPREITWEYRPGATPPSAIVIELRGAMRVDANEALVNPVVLDTYSTAATATTRTAVIGKFPFLDLNVSSITIGGGDPLDGLMRL